MQLTETHLIDEAGEIRWDVAQDMAEGLAYAVVALPLKNTLFEDAKAEALVQIWHAVESFQAKDQEPHRGLVWHQAHKRMLSWVRTHGPYTRGGNVRYLRPEYATSIDNPHFHNWESKVTDSIRNLEWQFDTPELSFDNIPLDVEPSGSGALLICKGRNHRVRRAADAPLLKRAVLQYVKPPFPSAVDAAREVGVNHNTLSTVLTNLGLSRERALSRTLSESVARTGKPEFLEGEALRLVDADPKMTLDDLAETLGISRAQAYRYVRPVWEARQLKRRRRCWKVVTEGLATSPPRTRASMASELDMSVVALNKWVKKVQGGMLYPVDKRDEYILKRLRESPDILQTQLAREMRLSQPSVSTRIIKLTERGYIKP